MGFADLESDLIIGNLSAFNLVDTRTHGRRGRKDTILARAWRGKLPGFGEGCMLLRGPAAQRADSRLRFVTDPADPGRLYESNVYPSNQE